MLLYQAIFWEVEQFEHLSRSYLGLKVKIEFRRYRFLVEWNHWQVTSVSFR